MPMHRYLKWTLSFHKYPRYFVDLYVGVILRQFWRSRGMHIGRGTVWHGRPILARFDGSSLHIGDGCLICSRSANTTLGINHPVTIRTIRTGALLHVGNGVRMSGISICAAEKVIIGDRCVIGTNVIIADTDFHSLDPVLRSSPEDANFAVSRPVEICNDVFIGCNAIILKGVSIGAGAVVGAGSIVRRDVPAGAVVLGNPAKAVYAVETLCPSKEQDGQTIRPMRR